jgi:hypothetical protein
MRPFTRMTFNGVDFVSRLKEHVESVRMDNSFNTFIQRKVKSTTRKEAIHGYEFH